jgi:predicted lipid-binding transport protein (Tim44 family)
MAHSEGVSDYLTEEQDDRKPAITIDDFARLKKELDDITSLTTAQFFIAALGGTAIIVFFGFIGVFLFGGFWGSIAASVLSALSIVVMVQELRDRNFRAHLRREKETKSKEIDEYIETKERKAPD